MKCVKGSSLSSVAHRLGKNAPLMMEAVAGLLEPERRVDILSDIRFGERWRSVRKRVDYVAK